MSWPRRLHVIRLCVLLCASIVLTFGMLRPVFAETEKEGPSSEVSLIQEGPPVAGLTWSSDPIKFKKVESDKGEIGYFVTLKGTFDQSYADLLWNMRKIISTKDQVPQDFSVQVQVSSPATTLRVRTVNARGELGKSTVIISVPDYQRRVMVLSTPSKFKLLASMGYSVIQYREGSVSLDMTGVTVKGTVLYQLAPGEWDVALNTYLTALPISQSISTTTARFLGINARVGYTVPDITSPWNLSIMMGFYYTTMLVANNRFGFKDMMGPQFFPVLRYQVSPNSTLGLYAKYSPILTENGLLPFSQRELASGLSYTHLMRNGHPFSVSADFAELKLLVDRIPVSSTSISLSLGYGW